MTKQNVDENVTLSAEVESALMAAPVVRVREGFAARVAAAAAAQPAAHPLSGLRVRRRMSLGRAVSVGAMVVLTAALFVVAPLAGTHVQSWPFALEMVLLVQLAAVGFGVVRAGVRE